MELYVLMKNGNPVVVTSQGKHQPKVYLSRKNALNAKANIGDPDIIVEVFVPKTSTCNSLE